MKTIIEERYQPPHRRLRVFSIDPSLATQLKTAVINEILVKVPWEIDPTTGKSSLKAGPVGEYIEVVDYDPASRSYYAPVDLNDPALLATDGLTPSEGNPQFHQQMVYAVAMTTIGHFEQALGRVMLWAPRLVHDEQGNVQDGVYVQRLRIYPHALREANAYYSPKKKALLFGYFPTTDADPASAPGTMVFTCLSHDIIVHETTHALLDGMHPRFSESTNYDVLALHEAFADIAALFQHFSHPEVLHDQIAMTRGDLASQNLLGQLAQQLGRAIGRGSALRDALGGPDDEGVWRPKEPDPRRYEQTTAPHARGSVLVAAVFDAFLLIYKDRIADLLRIATQGTGVLPPGEIHPDLVQRLAQEAAKSARHVLHMCIRALDYCPPVDVTFGDYLRAIITADYDLNPEDDRRYRVAVIEAFRRWGIYPRGIRNLSLDTLRWPSGIEAQQDVGELVAIPVTDVTRDAPVEMEQAYRKAMQQDVRSLFVRQTDLPGEQLPPLGEPGINVEPEEAGLDLILDWDLESDRNQAWNNMKHNARVVHHWLTQGHGKKYIPAFGLTLSPTTPPSVYRDEDGITPELEVHAVRTALRRGSKGSLITELVVEITQRRRGYFEPAEQEAVDAGQREIDPDDDGDFTFRRGCTLLINPGTMAVRRVIRTAGSIDDNRQMERVRAFLTREDPPPNNAFDGGPFRGTATGEWIAQLHRA